MLIPSLAQYALRKSSWRNMLLQSQKKAVKSANSYFKQHAIFPGNSGISSIEKFKEYVPISNKSLVFDNKSLKDLTASKFNKVKFVMMSSGSSEKFSIGVFTKEDMKYAAQNTDLFLNIFFGAKKNQTLIINASSMGVRVFSNYTVSDTGPRTDIVIGLLKSVAIHYDKIFIIGDPIFIKLMVEEAIEKNVNWSEYNCYFISGGEWMPETLREYVHQLTGKTAARPEKGYWLGTYGITEIGYPIFFETSELVLYRQQMKVPLGTMELMKQEPLCTTPFYFLFRANSFYLEEIYHNNSTLPRMVFTPLTSKRLIPVFRYDTGDVGQVVNEELPISFQPFPVVKFWGRDGHWMTINDHRIYISDIKELLFTNWEICPLITGFFTLSVNGNMARLVIQLKKDAEYSRQQKTQLIELLDRVYPKLVDVEFCDYHNMKYQMELDFERKFKPLI